MKNITIKKSIAIPTIIATMLLAITGVAFAARVAVIVPGVQQMSVVGSCQPGGTATASTTLFAVNPFFGVGTSTVTFGHIEGTQGATTTDIVIATSTVASISMTNVNVGSLNANYLIAPAISTSSQFFISNGMTRYPYTQATTTTGTGLVNLNSSVIVVGPNEYLLGYATSTYKGGNSTTTPVGLAVPSSCIYKFIFTQ